MWPSSKSLNPRHLAPSTVPSASSFVSIDLSSTQHQAPASSCYPGLCFPSLLHMVISNCLHLLETSDFLYSHLPRRSFKDPWISSPIARQRIWPHSLKNWNRKSYSFSGFHGPTASYSVVPVTPFSFSCLHCLCSSPVGKNKQYFSVSLDRLCNSFTEYRARTALGL